MTKELSTPENLEALRRETLDKWEKRTTTRFQPQSDPGDENDTKTAGDPSKNFGGYDYGRSDLGTNDYTNYDAALQYLWQTQAISMDDLDRLARVIRHLANGYGLSETEAFMAITDSPSPGMSSFQSRMGVKMSNAALRAIVASVYGNRDAMDEVLRQQREFSKAHPYKGGPRQAQALKPAVASDWSKDAKPTASDEEVQDAKNELTRRLEKVLAEAKKKALANKLVAEDGVPTDVANKVIGVKKALPLGSNPKDLLGIKKPSPFYFPPVAVLQGSRAMGNGAQKYGAFNWRGNAVIASIYISAAIRHIYSWQDGEQNASDSGIHHLGHALASIAILLDAEATGNLIDDRPPGGKFAELIEQFTTK